MARSREIRNRENTLSTVNMNTERTSKAISLLVQSWMHLGSQMIVGSTRIVADTLQDLNELYCNPRGGGGADTDDDVDYEERGRRRRSERWD